MNVIERFKSLPQSSRRLLSVGIIFALLVALPLFIWAIINLNFNPNKRAASGEPNTTPIVIQESFTGNGPLDPSRWNWSGSTGSNVVLENNRLKMTVPQGHDGVGGNDAVTQALVNYNIPIVAGDFDVSVDLAEVDSTLGWEELKFAPGPSISIRRNKTGSTETIEVWTSVDNTPSTNVKNASVDIPANLGSVRVKLIRTNLGVQAYYDFGSDFVPLFLSNMAGLSVNETLPRLVIENGSSTYPATTGFFDNYYASANLVNSESPSPVPTPTLTPSPSPSPTASPTATPSGTPPPTVRPFIINFKFGGVSDNSAESAKVTVRFRGGPAGNTVDYITPSLPVYYVGNGVYKLVFGTWSTDLPIASNYSLSLKGEKHLAVKFCAPSGQTLRCSQTNDPGHITIPDNSGFTVFTDFTGIPLEPGDLYPQDGAVDSNDFDKIKTLLSKPCAELSDQDKLTADVDYNGCVNARDAFLVRKTLETKYDEN